MKKTVLFSAIFVLPVLLPAAALFAQERQAASHYNWKLAFEFGMNEMTYKLVKPEQLRENRSSGSYSGDGYYDYGLFEDYSSAQTSYFGVKPEFFILKNRMGIASGIRFSLASSDLVSDKDNFLWKVREEGLNTDYVRINDIRQKSYLLGIPLEVRYFTNNRELPVQTYFKIGAALNYCVYSKHQVNFTDKAMQKYDGLIQSQLPESNALSFYMFGAVGLKIGKYREGHYVPWGNIELQFPYMLMTKNSFTFAGKGDSGSFPGVGIQVSFEIPVGKNVPIGSN